MYSLISNFQTRHIRIQSSWENNDFFSSKCDTCESSRYFVEN